MTVATRAATWHASRSSCMAYVCQAADARSHPKASKPHTSASHVAGETGVRRTIFLFFGIRGPPELELARVDPVAKARPLPGLKTGVLGR